MEIPTSKVGPRRSDGIWWDAELDDAEIPTLNVGPRRSAAYSASLL